MNSLISFSDDSFLSPLRLLWPLQICTCTNLLLSCSFPFMDYFQKLSELRHSNEWNFNHDMIQYFRHWDQTKFCVSNNRNIRWIRCTVVNSQDWIFSSRIEELRKIKNFTRSQIVYKTASLVFKSQLLSWTEFFGSPLSSPTISCNWL